MSHPEGKPREEIEAEAKQRRRESEQAERDLTNARLKRTKAEEEARNAEKTRRKHEATNPNADLAEVARQAEVSADNYRRAQMEVEAAERTALERRLIAMDAERRLTESRNPETPPDPVVGYDAGRPSLDIDRSTAPEVVAYKWRACLPYEKATPINTGTSKLEREEAAKWVLARHRPLAFEDMLLSQAPAKIVEFSKINDSCRKEALELVRKLLKARALVDGSGVILDPTTEPADALEAWALGEFKHVNDLADIARRYDRILTAVSAHQFFPRGVFEMLQDAMSTGDDDAVRVRQELVDYVKYLRLDNRLTGPNLEQLNGLPDVLLDRWMAEPGIRWWPREAAAVGPNPLKAPEFAAPVVPYLGSVRAAEMALASPQLREIVTAYFKPIIDAGQFYKADGQFVPRGTPVDDAFLQGCRDGKYHVASLPGYPDGSYFEHARQVFERSLASFSTGAESFLSQLRETILKRGPEAKQLERDLAFYVQSLVTEKRLISVEGEPLAGDPNQITLDWLAGAKYTWKPPEADALVEEDIQALATQPADLLQKSLDLVSVETMATLHEHEDAHETVEEYALNEIRNQAFEDESKRAVSETAFPDEFFRQCASSKVKRRIQFLPERARIISSLDEMIKQHGVDRFHLWFRGAFRFQGRERAKAEFSTYVDALLKAGRLNDADGKVLPTDTDIQVVMEDWFYGENEIQWTPPQSA